MKTPVSALLQKKRPEIFGVTPDTTVFDALKIMSAKDIGALLVMEGDKLVGIFSERDYARKVSLLGKSSVDTPIKDIMTPRVIFVKPSQTAEDCMALMSEKRIRHLPVMEDDKVIGVLSITDLVRHIISQQQFVIQQLENYIWG